MSPMPEFLLSVSRVFGEHGVDPGTSPARIIDQWKAFVDQCEKGYGWDLSEYDNELQVRELIRIVLDAQELQGFAELSEFKDQVESIDSRFRRLLQEEASRPTRTGKWWEDGVLRYSGEEYANDVRDLFGVDVRRVG